MNEEKILEELQKINFSELAEVIETAVSSIKGLITQITEFYFTFYKAIEDTAKADKVVYLAFYAKKARTRKKNINRIKKCVERAIKIDKKNGNKGRRVNQGV